MVITIGDSENGDVDAPRGTIFLYICVLVVVLGVRYSSSSRISMPCTHALIPDCHVCSCTNGPYFWSAKGDQASPPLSSPPGRCPPENISADGLVQQSAPVVGIA